MIQCPKCGYWYSVEHIERCPNCNWKLGSKEDATI
jgi:ssDNA-binding Zn-finger/Zn-ribbon topoisomerase 1